MFAKLNHNLDKSHDITRQLPKIFDNGRVLVNRECKPLKNFFSSTKIDSTDVIRYLCVSFLTTTWGPMKNPTGRLPTLRRIKSIILTRRKVIVYTQYMSSYVPIRTALDSVFEGDAIIKDTNLSPSLLWRARSQNLWLQRDKRPEGESSMADRPEGLSHGSARSSYLFPTDFFFSTCLRSMQVGHSIRVQIHLHLYRAHTREFSLPGCHLVTLRARRHRCRKTMKYVRNFLSRFGPSKVSARKSRFFY